MPITAPQPEDSGRPIAPRGAGRAALAAFVVILVAVAFGRATLASSTGIQISGDGADYARIAEAGRLEGRAPFVYRPLVPLLVGIALPDRTTLGFALICAFAMFAALYGAADAAMDRLAGYGLALILLLNYQVLFSAANPARLDIVVLAVQIGFVRLALRRAELSFFVLLPVCALLKESMLPGLAALAMVAFRRDRGTLVKLGGASLAFIALHVLVRASAEPTGFMPPYTVEGLSFQGMTTMLRSNISWLTPLDFLVAWGGLAFVAGFLALRGHGAHPDFLLAGVTTTLLLFPLPLATDVHRAWFELLAPTVLFFLLPGLSRARRPWLFPALGLALLAGTVPYAVHFLTGDHLYLVVLEDRLTPVAILGAGVALTSAAGALVCWLVPDPAGVSSGRASRAESSQAGE